MKKIRTIINSTQQLRYLYLLIDKMFILRISILYSNIRMHKQWNYYCNARHQLKHSFSLTKMYVFIITISHYKTRIKVQKEITVTLLKINWTIYPSQLTRIIISYYKTGTIIAMDWNYCPNGKIQVEISIPPDWRSTTQTRSAVCNHEINLRTRDYNHFPAIIGNNDPFDKDDQKQIAPLSCLILYTNLRLGIGVSSISPRSPSGSP